MKTNSTTTPEEYTAAIEELLAVAIQPTGGGRVAAQVLLSAYNGFDYQLDISNMGSLDRKNFELAMTVIRGRYEVGREPHEVIPNGSLRFHGLRKAWPGLHVGERGKFPCPSCDGRGFRWVDEMDDTNNKKTPCTRCKETGRIYDFQ